MSSKKDFPEKKEKEKYEDLVSALYIKEKQEGIYGVGKFHDFLLDFSYKAYLKNKELQHYRDTTVGLWATDRPDLIEDPKGIMFRLEK